MALSDNTAAIQAILGIVQELPEMSTPKLQEKSVTPGDQVITVVPDSGYDGLSKVTVGAAAGGVTVQRNSGTFTTSTNGTATVNCGFKPDLVVVKVGTSSFDSTQNDPAFAFVESSKTKLSITSVSKSSSYIMTTNTCTQNTSGFSITMNNISSSFSTAPVSRTTFSYIAVKYTE